jgi:HD domain-containing protein
MRVGSYQWAKQTGGALTRAERRHLIGEIARSYHRLLIDRARLALGRVPEAAKAIGAEPAEPPDSRLAREAEAACAEQPESVVGHSYRTWIFGTALAKLDGSELDPELFYVASLLHDAGIPAPVAEQDFTVRSAEAALAVAERCGVEAGPAAAIADGICGHFTPGARIEADGPIAYYVQNGALADLIGVRRPDVAPAVRERAETAHPRGDAGREIGAMVRAESKAVPDGRVALVQRWAAFSLAARFGPSG